MGRRYGVALGRLRRVAKGGPAGWSTGTRTHLLVVMGSHDDAFPRYTPCSCSNKGRSLLSPVQECLGRVLRHALDAVAVRWLYLYWLVAERTNKNSLHTTCLHDTDSTPPTPTHPPSHPPARPGFPIPRSAPLRVSTTGKCTLLSQVDRQPFPGYLPIGLTSVSSSSNTSRSLSSIPLVVGSRFTRLSNHFTCARQSDPSADQ